MSASDLPPEPTSVGGRLWSAAVMLVATGVLVVADAVGRALARRGR